MQSSFQYTLASSQNTFALLQKKFWAISRPETRLSLSKTQCHPPQDVRLSSQKTFWYIVPKHARICPKYAFIFPKDVCISSQKTFWCFVPKHARVFPKHAYIDLKDGCISSQNIISYPGISFRNTIESFKNTLEFSQNTLEPSLKTFTSTHPKYVNAYRCITRVHRPKIRCITSILSFRWLTRL